MAKSAMIRARVEPDLKNRAEAILDKLGLSATTAITMFYRQILQKQGVPFELRIPNATTRKAMLDARSERGVNTAGSLDDMFAQLDDHETSKSAPRRKRRARGAR
ncbi:MAG: type II toxin-antitoxin system RelB/DinJ family antitoxin [Gemmatimonadaceae bacterium]